MVRASATHVKKTISLPLDLVIAMRARSSNVSSFIAQACREKLQADDRKALETALIERCHARHSEDLALADEFFPAEQEAWDAAQ